jgi:NAD(P)H-flavin reductase
VLGFCLDNRQDFGDITVLYGCRTPTDFCFHDSLAGWAGEGRLELQTTIDNPDLGWDGRVGLVTALLEPGMAGDNTTGRVCGPGIMIRFVVEKLRSLGLADDNIITTLERHMKCGIGTCGHCHFDGRMICTDGPVFKVSELPDLENL